LWPRVKFPSAHEIKARRKVATLPQRAAA
jgi:hypothetical protein